ncbi:MAG: polysaccharide biosynthesis/export family protein [Hyphomicrobium sp.]|nr:polysaccharide biosynthesis/export family protein [Hyphomicrobium sp.]
MRVRAFLAVFAAVASLGSSASAQEAEGYRLGVQDRLRIHVHEWPILTGEFVVGANGSLILPLIGVVQAKGLEPSQLASQISNRLRERAKLGATPDTTVDVTQYRPFYILGGVERPGEYSYRPGMLVVNAVAIAGGIFRPPRTSDWGFERDAINGRGDLRLAAVRRDELAARELRLKAEAEGSEVFPPVPPALSARATRFIDEERLLFSARIDRHRNQFLAYQETIKLIEGEIKSLEAQIAAARKQEDSVAKELEDTRGHVARALIPAPRLLPIERTLAQIEREMKEISTQIMRARQQINATKILRDNLKDERRSTALTELQALEVQRKELDERVETASRLVSGSQVALSSAEEPGEVSGTPTYIIVRQRNNLATELPASETTVLEPGDIVKVYRPQDAGSSRGRAGGAPRSSTQEQQSQ